MREASARAQFTLLRLVCDTAALRSAFQRGPAFSSPPDAPANFQDQDEQRQQQQQEVTPFQDWPHGFDDALVKRCQPFGHVLSGRDARHIGDG